MTGEIHNYNLEPEKATNNYQQSASQSVQQNSPLPPQSPRSTRVLVIAVIIIVIIIILATVLIMPGNQIGLVNNKPFTAMDGLPIVEPIAEDYYHGAYLSKIHTEIRNVTVEDIYNIDGNFEWWLYYFLLYEDWINERMIDNQGTYEITLYMNGTTDETKWTHTHAPIKNLKVDSDELWSIFTETTEYSELINIVEDNPNGALTISIIPTTGPLYDGYYSHFWKISYGTIKYNFLDQPYLDDVFSYRYPASDRYYYEEYP